MSPVGSDRTLTLAAPAAPLANFVVDTGLWRTAGVGSERFDAHLNRAASQTETAAADVAPSEPPRDDSQQRQRSDSSPEAAPAAAAPAASSGDQPGGEADPPAEDAPAAAERPGGAPEEADGAAEGEQPHGRDDRGGKQSDEKAPEQKTARSGPAGKLAEQPAAEIAGDQRGMAVTDGDSRAGLKTANPEPSAQRSEERRGETASEEHRQTVQTETPAAEAEVTPDNAEAAQQPDQTAVLEAKDGRPKGRSEGNHPQDSSRGESAGKAGGPSPEQPEQSPPAASHEPPSGKHPQPEREGAEVPTRRGGQTQETPGGAAPQPTSRLARVETQPAAAETVVGGEAEEPAEPAGEARNPLGAASAEARADGSPPRTPLGSRAGPGPGQPASDGSPPGQAERGQFVARVARAIQAMGEREGPVRLKLHPPELGSLRIEIQVRGGVLTARAEAETSAARNLLLDNLPVLRDRLAQQDIKVQQFEVDLGNRSSGGTSQQTPHQAPFQEHTADARREPPPPAAAEETADSPEAVTRPGERTQLNVLI